jgi:Omp85 superfamily domain/Surface antigen variable number repeat
LTAAFLLAFLFQASAALSGPAADVREIAVTGASVYEREDVSRIVRQREGQILRAPPDVLAARLQSRYHLDGYLAASVSGHFTDGTLTFTIDEGPLAEVVVEGVDTRSAQRAARAADLAPGRVIEQSQVWDALARIERASEGALRPDGDPPYRVEPGPSGARLVLRVRRVPASFMVRPAGPRAAGRYNRVDGLSLGVLGEATIHNTASYDHTQLWALGSYGFSAEQLRYALGAARSVFGQKAVVGYEYHDLTDTDDTWHKRGLEEGTGGIINNQATSDYFRRVGHHAFLFAHGTPQLELGASFRWDYYTSLPVVTDDSLLGYKEPRPNPLIEEGRMRSAVFAAGWTSRGALFPDANAKKRSFVQRNLYQLGVTKPEGVRVEATFEIARPDWGSDYDFTRLIGNVRTHHQVSAHFILDTRFVGGATGGTPPSFKRFYLGGTGTLRGYDIRQFDGTEMAVFTVEGSLVPGRFFPSVIPFYEGGRTFGEGENPAERWRSALGVGVRWPARGTLFFLRLDTAWPLDAQPGQDGGPQVYWRIGIPF